MKHILTKPRSELLCAVINLLALGVTLVFVPVGPALGAEWTLDQEQLVEQPQPYSRFVDQHFPKRVFFGDTHHHSSLSVDSGLIVASIGVGMFLSGIGYTPGN